MFRKCFTALVLGLTLSASAPMLSHAQNTTGSDGGFVSPGNSGPSGGGAKNTVANNSPGTPGSAPETSLSRRNGAEPATREGDVPRQIGVLLPAALLMFLFLAGGLYWFVFRKPSTPEGEAASTGNKLQ